MDKQWLMLGFPITGDYEQMKHKSSYLRQFHRCLNTGVITSDTILQQCQEYPLSDRWKQAGNFVNTSNRTEHDPIWELWPGLVLILLNSGLNQHSVLVEKNKISCLHIYFCEIHNRKKFWSISKSLYSILETELESSNGMAEVTVRADGQKTVVPSAELQRAIAVVGVAVHDVLQSSLDLPESSNTDHHQRAVGW